jgi:hypothetical protein
MEAGAMEKRRLGMTIYLLYCILQERRGSNIAFYSYVSTTQSLKKICNFI